MSSSPKRIQGALKEVNHPLFQIKDLTSIISNYAVAFPNKVIHEKFTNYTGLEVRLCTDMLVVNARFEQSLNFLKLEEDGRLTETKRVQTNSGALLGFDLDIKENKIILVDVGIDIGFFDGSCSSKPPYEIKPITTIKSPVLENMMDVVMDSKNNTFYVIAGGQLITGDLKLSTIRTTIDLGAGGRELQLCSQLNLLAIRFRSHVIVYTLSDLKIKFKLMRESECICFSIPLNSLVVNTKNRILFYNLNTGVCFSKIINSGINLASMVFDSNTGYLIASNVASSSLIVFGA